MHSSCPGCLSDKVHFKQSYLFANSINENFIVCNNCGLWFKEQIISSDDLLSYYENIDIRCDSWNYDKLLPHEKRIAEILEALPPSSKVLDFGCWTGRILSQYESLFDVYGIEPNTSANKIAQSRGLTIIESFMLKDSPYENSFDCIIIIDVFEHLPQPTETLKLLISALKPGGKLLMVTGNTDSIPSQLIGVNYWYFLLEGHIVFLNHKFLDWLQNNINNIDVSAFKIRHFEFTLKRFFYEFTWLFLWFFFGSMNLLCKIKFKKYNLFSKFGNFQQPIMCTSWKDHYLIEIKKTF